MTEHWPFLTLILAMMDQAQATNEDEAFIDSDMKDTVPRNTVQLNQTA